ncbi:thioesterase II family protein [Microbispora triticiradicis]|uniref:Thioesterase n=2 Tax=Microbispora TaxID=2005 RepID=A0ABY3LM72_9ACTN|nr:MULTISPECIES: thioesterase domain-containing protein [Microbispora]TLP50897.1 thioesterase [Microbispora fusca]TYB41691.1 thioesterase [Microbispora tritici]
MVDSSIKKPNWLLRRPDPDAGARLFCFPYSGSGATMYERWPRRIGDVEICLVQPPGRQNRIREPHYETYERLAAQLIEVLVPYLDRPFAFFGHCSGALPGVEITRQLAAAGLPLPQRLFVSAQVAPHDGPYGRLLELDHDGLRQTLADLITNMGGTPSDALLDFGLDLLIRDVEANKRYVVPAPLDIPCGITAIGWSQDNQIPFSLMGGWEAMTADCRSMLLDGGHFSFLAAPPALLAQIARDLTGGAGARGPA